MKDSPLFSITPDGEFFGRSVLINHILRTAKETLHPSPSILLKGKRWVGKTEILRRVHRELFRTALVIPFYYQFKDFTLAADLAEDYIKELVKQYLAFTGRRPGLSGAPTSLHKLRRLLTDSGAGAAADILSRHMEAKKDSDHTALLRNAIGAPGAITKETGLPVFLILDDLERLSGTALYRAGPAVLKEFTAALKEPSASFIASSPVATTLEGLLSGGYLETLQMGGLDEDDAVAMMAELSRSYSVEFDSEMLAVAARRLGGNPMYMKEVLLALKRGDRGGLKDLKGLADLYVSEVSCGAVAKALASAIELGGVNDLRVLNLLMKEAGPVSLEEICDSLDLEREGAILTAVRLERFDLAERTLGAVRWAGDRVERDYIEYTCSTVLRGMSPEEARTWMVRDILKEGFAVKSEKIREELKEETFAVIKSFEGRPMPAALFRAAAFADKGAHVEKGGEEITLPFITGCFDAAAAERNEKGVPVVIAHGFQNKRYNAGNEVVWITGVKDSAMPVNTGDVKNFLRRAAILSKRFQSGRVMRWLVSREGFSKEAMTILDREGVYSTDGAALDLLRKKSLATASEAPSDSGFSPHSFKEFEVVLPASKNAELVGVRAAAEISSEMGFDEESIARIKASVVEACINAFEHRGTRAGKTHLRFVSAPDRLTIYISNPGVDFDETSLVKSREGSGALPRKRGWGIELMKGFMDEVRFERVDGGARMVLVKYLIKKGVEKNDRAR
ncbi:MAG: ATP-binding protein [Thermodesulfobacteriota bacterium]